MNKVFRLLTVLMIFTTSLSAQQFYKKEIKDIKTDLVKTLATSEGGILVYNTFPEDTMLFQLIKYDTCGSFEWSKQYSDTLADSTAQPLIILDQSNNARVLYLDHTNKLTDIVLFQLDDKGSILNQTRIVTSLPITSLDNIAFHNQRGIYVTAHTQYQSKPEAITYLFNIDLNNNISWIQTVDNQYHGISIIEDTLLLSSIPSEMNSSISIEAIDIVGSHLWRKEFENIKSVSNIIENQARYSFIGEINSGVTDTANHTIIQMDYQGEITITGERFASFGEGTLLKNDAGPLYVHYDTLFNSPDLDENLSFLQFNSTSEISEQHTYDDVNDTLNHGPIGVSLLPDNNTLAFANFGSDSTTNFMYMVKMSTTITEEPEASAYSIGMESACNPELSEGKDTSITITNSTLSISDFSTINWTKSSTDNVNVAKKIEKGENKCEITPKSSATPIPHCIGEEIEIIDNASGKTILITKNTSVIVNQFPWCGELIIKTQDHEFFETKIHLPMPKAFTPNGDRENDDFGVITDTMKVFQLNSFEMRIYNRWGNQVFKSEDINTKWNGMYNGKPALPEVYLYYIAYKGKLRECDIDQVVKGDVTLIK